MREATVFICGDSDEDHREMAVHEEFIPRVKVGREGLVPL